MDWIQGNMFHGLAKWTFAPPHMSNHDYYYFQNTLRVKELRDGDIIYTQGFHLYKRALLEKIKNTKQVILISHNCDEPLDDTYVIPKNVIKWYALNVDTYNPKAESIPNGIETDKFRGVEKKEKMLAKMQEKKNFRNLVYMDHRTQVNPTVRIRPYEVLSNKPWVTSKTDKDNVSYAVYLDNLYHHKFNVCPRGNGMDTHRVWETLYMGTIPIQIRDLNNRFYTDLPILFINDWDELTEELLSKEYDRITNTTWKTEMLTFAYWNNKILNTTI